MSAAAQWRSTSQPTLDYGNGGEQVARAMMVQVVQNLAAQCVLVDNLWSSRDQDFAAVMEIPYRRTVTTVPARTSVYLGAQPSLVVGAGARFDKWPAITVRADVRSPDGAFQADQWDANNVEVVVEVLAAAGPFKVDPVEDRTLSDAIDRQYQRLCEAVVGCVNVDRSLGGSCLPIQSPPRMVPSLPFVKKLESGAGAWSIYQGAELSWTIQTQTRVPGL
jgi:hypothetical protein